jgi:biopolymer transport protein ExbD
VRIDLGDDENVEVALAPLIDCVFLLLIFFLVASSLRKPTLELPLQLPVAGTAAAAQERTQPLTVQIDAAGVVYLQNQPVELDELGTRLRPLLDDASPRVRFLADRTVPYERVMSVLDVLRAHGIQQVGLQTAPRQR